MNNDISQLLCQELEKAAKERGSFSVLIAGRSGVGKSTLINAVFQADMVQTGQGKPVTQNTREVTKEGIPLTIFDTRGLEMSGFKETLAELEMLVKERCSDTDSNRHIHAGWICIQEDGRRVEQAEIDLCDMLAKHMPVIVVITKSRRDDGFRNEVQRLLPDAKNVIRVRAIGEEFDDGHVIPAMGLETLVELTSEVIPEGKRRALAAAQKASVEYKKSESMKVVSASAVLAAGIGAVPIAFSDAIALAPVQIGMLARVTTIFGLGLSAAELSTILTAGLGIVAAPLVGRQIVTTLLKLIPGANIAGGAIAATTAATLTTALGKAYISALAALLEAYPDARPTATDIANELKKVIREKLA